MADCKSKLKCEQKMKEQQIREDAHLIYEKEIVHQIFHIKNIK